MFIVDAHLDLSMNAMEWNRDLRKELREIRKRERGLKDKADRGRGLVSLPELRKGNIGLVVATQIARFVKPGSKLPGWNSPEQAWAQTQGQLAWYKAMELEGELRMINDLKSLRSHLKHWNAAEKPATGSPKTIGYILSLEGADSLVDLDYLDQAYAYGLRAIGPAHYGPGRYANGTDSKGHLNEAGRNLLKRMQALNIILDATHLCDDAFWDALDLFGGPVWASHNNCRFLVNHNRQFSDEQLKALIRRKAVIGAAFDAWMIVPGWKRGISNPRDMQCNADRVIDHIVHICMLAGDSDHVGIGSDLDGAYGQEQTPYDIRTIADLQRIPEKFFKRGFRDNEVKKLMHGNWLAFLERAWKK